MNKYIISIFLLLFFDILWIYLYMGPKYQQMIFEIQKSSVKVNYLFVILSYLLMIMGLCIFVLPNIKKETVFKDSIKYGLIFGIILYGVYDFTIASVLNKWNIKLAIIDVLWGGFIFFIVPLISIYINEYF